MLSRRILEPGFWWELFLFGVSLSVVGFLFVGASKAFGWPKNPMDVAFDTASVFFLFFLSTGKTRPAPLLWPYAAITLTLHCVLVAPLIDGRWQGLMSTKNGFGMVLIGESAPLTVGYFLLRSFFVRRRRQKMRARSGPVTRL